jgi:hypothetical protein
MGFAGGTGRFGTLRLLCLTHRPPEVHHVGLILLRRQTSATRYSPRETQKDYRGLRGPVHSSTWLLSILLLKMYSSGGVMLPTPISWDENPTGSAPLIGQARTRTSLR